MRINHTARALEDNRSLSSKLPQYHSSFYAAPRWQLHMSCGRYAVLSSANAWGGKRCRHDSCIITQRGELLTKCKLLSVAKAALAHSPTNLAVTPDFHVSNDKDQKASRV